jgi:hypothetical protein
MDAREGEPLSRNPIFQGFREPAPWEVNLQVEPEPSPGLGGILTALLNAEPEPEIEA